MDELIKIVSNLGFPIAVSLYLLIRFEAKIELLSSSINNLTNVISGKIGNNANEK
ncbi:MAG TPA: YvrJ family protein [Clostridiaceae bacterium]